MNIIKEGILKLINMNRPQKVRLFKRSSFNGCYAIFMQPRG
ncbi:hypothetical protein CNEO3_170001 [Clostridium neonatale]|nr:hypothetical protein CNEO4_1000001 [Clostridium neonatale]CAI3539536.1 hypothetical protein CNEO4_160001 [Clostridium neonatale]CAI3601172.1 hypothetical protein CNEO3_170001 [Clostridium neonatale]CAI3605851.1 hypothetical protein CNEO3_190001 [Clostridium neonatale]CAI3609861.1 hypothetical protein CNEO3_190001 [Clostridium neonatale]